MIFMRRTIVGIALILVSAGYAGAQQPRAADMPQEMVWVSRAGEVLGRVGAVQN